MYKWIKNIKTAQGYFNEEKRCADSVHLYYSKGDCAKTVFYNDSVQYFLGKALEINTVPSFNPFDKD